MGIFSVLYSVIDAKNAISNTEIAVPDTFSLVQITSFATQMAALIDPLMKGKITRIGIVLAVTLPGGLKATPATDADVEEGARFQFNSAGGFYTGLRLPTFDEALIQPGTKVVDVFDADVLAFIGGMVSGLDVGGVQVTPSDKRQADVVSLKSAVEQFQSSRRA